MKAPSTSLPPQAGRPANAYQVWLNGGETIGKFRLEGAPLACGANWVRGNKGGEPETIIDNGMNERNNHDKIIMATRLGSDMREGKSFLKSLS